MWRRREPSLLCSAITAQSTAFAIVAELHPHALSLTFVPVPDHEHHPPGELAQQLGGRASGSLEEALSELPAPRLIAGSLYLAGEALRRNEQAPD
jgi:dihydrofolate synthase/folylpolyglutamate synthase